MAKELWESLTFSGLQRYVRISETVRNSDAYLSCDDRHQLICDLLDEKGNPTVAEIEKRCAELADVNLGYNMTNAQILRTAHLGY